MSPSIRGVRGESQEASEKTPKKELRPLLGSKKTLSLHNVQRSRRPRNSSCGKDRLGGLERLEAFGQIFRLVGSDRSSRRRPGTLHLPESIPKKARQIPLSPIP